MYFYCKIASKTVDYLIIKWYGMIRHGMIRHDYTRRHSNVVRCIYLTVYNEKS